ncbi:MAG TPA: helix-turn-helix domain-containing protein [Candidatus Nanoarchaeia archaeon]|nr:helix-turn-helix domain-containing protein [Candidatus Nanoarchaeia archaeon]
MDNIQLLTRKEATCSDLLSCLYNLKPIDLEVFLEVAKKESVTLDQVAQVVHRDRSSTHRCLSKLLSAGLVNKQTKPLKGGGYFHVYSAVEPAKIKQQARQKVKDITEGLENLIESFESDLTKHLQSAPSSV